MSNKEIIILWIKKHKKDVKEIFFLFLLFWVHFVYFYFIMISLNILKGHQIVDFLNFQHALLQLIKFPHLTCAVVLLQGFKKINH